MSGQWSNKIVWNTVGSTEEESWEGWGCTKDKIYYLNYDLGQLWLLQCYPKGLNES